MTIPDHIVALALLALDDPDAVQVLEDAMIEDGREWGLVHQVPDSRWSLALLQRDAPGFRLTPAPIAIAAVGLTQYWGTSMWPVAERCWVDAWPALYDLLWSGTSRNPEAPPPPHLTFDDFAAQVRAIRHDFPRGMWQPIHEPYRPCGALIGPECERCPQPLGSCAEHRT